MTCTAPTPVADTDHDEVSWVPTTLTVQQASHLLGISLRSAYRAAEAGQLPTLRLGRRVFVPTRRLLAMIGMSAADLAWLLDGPEGQR